MKFLHLADLHLGKRLNDVSLLQDQLQLLSQVVSIAKEQKVDAVLVAGDVYQKAAPPSEAMTAFDDFITRLCSEGIQVFVISGNHDSAERIAYFGSLLRKSGVHVSTRFDGRLQQTTLQDEYGQLTISLLPFVKPIQVRPFFPEQKIETYQQAVQAVLRSSPLDISRRNVLLCHQFITGAETCDSEEKTVGGLDQIDAGLFDAFDYVALGHIHKPQKCGREAVRYAGSLMKYSFSEVSHRKSVTLVEMGRKGDVKISTLPLTAPHEMRLVSGLLEEVLAMPYSQDYVWVTLHDELPPPDARVMVSTVFPNMLKFSVVNSKTKLDMDVLAKEAMESKSPEQLFQDFYRLQNNDQLPSPRHMKILGDILKELEDKPQ